MLASSLLAAALATTAVVRVPSRAAADLAAPAVVKAILWAPAGGAGATRVPAVLVHWRGSRSITSVTSDRSAVAAPRVRLVAPRRVSRPLAGVTSRGSSSRGVRPTTQRGPPRLRSST